MEIIASFVGLAATVVGATWALRSALTRIELAVQGHVAEDRVTHAAQEARIVKLERRRGR